MEILIKKHIRNNMRGCEWIMKIHEVKEILICLIQQQINRDNAMITLIQDTNKKREQLLLKLCDYDRKEKKHDASCKNCGLMPHLHDDWKCSYTRDWLFPDTIPMKGSISWNYPNPYVSQNDN